MKYCLLIFLSIVLCSGCSSLTKTQTRAINQYFQSVNSYSTYPLQVNNALAHIKLNRSQLYPNTFDNDSIMMESLISSLKTFKSEIRNQSEIQLILKDYDSYVKDYFLLIPNGFNILKILESTSVTVAGFFGLNRVVSTAFSNIKTVKISSKKAKKIKAHILNGNALVDKTSKDVSKYISEIVKPKLLIEQDMLKKNYSLFLGNVKSSHDSFDYYSKYNKIFTEHYMLILNTELLVDKLLAVSSQISISQKKLNSIIEERKKLSKDVVEIQELYILTSELNRIIAQFETIQ